MAEETAQKNGRCIYCGERLGAAPAGDKSATGASHPGGPNACIALALVRLRKSIRALVPKAKR